MDFDEGVWRASTQEGGAMLVFAVIFDGIPAVLHKARWEE